jgi:pimeloyl-ACP methyl ester carboxylesterase
VYAVAGAFSWPQTNASKKTVPENTRILILPGFGNDSRDYTMEGSLVSSLQRRGWEESQIDVLPVKRSDWLQVFWRGALDLEFWKGTAPPNRPAFRWYLERISNKVQALQEDEYMILLGHSAGGWLARAAVGYGAQEEQGELSIDIEKIKAIVTLGAPNLPPPPQVMDMTRGALRITNEEFPGAFHAPDTKYVTVIGEAIQGKKQERKSPLEPTSVTGFAYNSYEVVCGDGTTIGDGVVPTCSAHVDGATQLTLQGVFHSINAPEQWYGADKVIDEWHDIMLDEIATTPAKFDPMKIFSQSR